jgi:hypothetical protein
MSSLVQTTVTKARPGRRHDAVALGIEAAKLLERHGAADSRLLAADVAGEQTGTHVFSTEFESGEVWGEFNDSLAADAELEALMNRVEGTDSPVDMVSMSLANDIPLGRDGPDDRGGVVEAYISRVVPGRFDGALELATTVFDFVEAHGASACRLMQLTSAGMLSDCLVATWELESMKALGRLGDAYGAAPEGHHILEVLSGANGPVTTVTSGIYRVIPL